MRQLRFLQFSDLHLDSGLLHSRLNLPADKRAQINRDIQHALARIVDVARGEEVDVVLCPGDLWDDESVSFESATYIYDSLGSLAPIPVLIAPGNHDPYNAFSYHHPHYYRTKVGKPHPRNIHVFGSPTIERRALVSLPDADFYGFCFEENVPRTERLLRGLRPQRDDAINVLLLHGSLDDRLPCGNESAMAAPFSADEILASGFDYAAVGHYHSHARITAADGSVRAAYAGVPAARTLDETGEHGVLVGVIDKGGVRPESLKFVSVDSRRIVRLRVEIDATVTHTAAACARIEAALRTAQVTRRDIVYAELHGRLHPEISFFDFDPAWRDDLCFHLSIDQDGLEPEHDIDALLADESARRRVEGRFAERMRQMIAEAPGDEARRRILRAALCHGLDALAGREVRPRNVH